MSAAAPPAWLSIARTKIGAREMPGPGSAAWIKSMWLALKGGAWFWGAYGQDDSKLPWCGAFVAWALQRAQCAYPVRYASAKAWLDWGEPCGADLGAVAVLLRDGGGHVGFVDAVSQDGRYIRLVGGNQGDAVSASWFSAGRVLGYRRPVGASLHDPAVMAVGNLSLSEA